MVQDKPDGVKQAPAGHLRMALVNMHSRMSDLPDPEAGKTALRANVDRHHWFIDYCADRGARFVGFPEVSLQGYRFSDHTRWLGLDSEPMRELADHAARRAIYLAVGLAEEDEQGARWNTQALIGPDGRLLGRHHKIWLTLEKDHVRSGDTHEVFEVDGHGVGMLICADGTDYRNLRALADGGARLIYAAHANTTGGTIAGWYRFRARWGGAWDGTWITEDERGGVTQVPGGGWIGLLGVYAALHNNAGRYGKAYCPPPEDQPPTGWASGAWFIAPDGSTLAQMPSSEDPADSCEYVLMSDIPWA